MFFLAAYLITMSGHTYSADAIVKYHITERLLKKHRLDMDPSIGMYITAGKGGKYYSTFPIGLSVAYMPFYLLGDFASRVFGTFPREFLIEFSISLMNAFVTAAICLVLFLFCRHLNYSLKTSLATAFIYGFATIAWPYAKTSWGEPLVALLLLLAAYTLSRFRKKADIKWPVLCGMLLGFGAIVRYEATLFAPLFLPFFAVHILWNRKNDWQKLITVVILFSIPFAAFMSINLLYNYIRFGDFFKFGGYQTTVELVGNMVQSPKNISVAIFAGLYTYFFSPGKSIFFFSPPAILFFWAIGGFYKKHKSEALLCILIPSTLLLVFSSFWMVSGAAWGSRYTVTIIPFLILPLAALIEGLSINKNRKLKYACVILCVVGLLVQLLAISTSYQVVFDELTDKEEHIDYLLIRFDPEHAPILLHLQEFISDIPATIKMLIKGPQALNPKLFQGRKNNPSVFESAPLRQFIRRNTFDFWFLYAYFIGVPLLLIVFSLCLLLMLGLLCAHHIHTAIKNTHIAMQT